MDGWKRVVCWVMYNYFFRRGRRTDDNLFMLERMIEMAKVRVFVCGFYRYGKSL